MPMKGLPFTVVLISLDNTLRCLKNPMSGLCAAIYISCTEILHYHFHLSSTGQSVVVAQLVLEIGEMPVEAVRGVGYVQLPPLLENKQMRHIPSQAAVCLAQVHMRVCGAFLSVLLEKSSLIQGFMPLGIPHVQ